MECLLKNVASINNFSSSVAYSLAKESLMHTCHNTKDPVQ